MNRAAMSPLPSKCKQCKVKFTPEERAKGNPLHDRCVPAFAEDYESKAHRANVRKQASTARKARKADKAQTKARKEALKRIPDLIRDAQREFNGFVRLRDCGQPCICCGKPLGAGEVGGAYDCGHYRSTGSAPHLRFDERNAHAQRKHCNRYGAGRAVDYRLGLIERIGLASVEDLEHDNRVHKWQRDELKAIAATYRAKRAQLERRA